MRCSPALLALLLLPAPSALPGQQWNDPRVGELIRRAIALRETPFADTTLRHYRSLAHGFVFFLAQFGRGFPDPPRLGKADELEVEVYWEAPNLSKQRIVGWRDESYLPYGMNYHRDHLGIVTNNYGPVIRIGDGDEVRDAVHPLSLPGLGEYDFALGDTLTLRPREGPIEVLTVQVRPRNFQRPLVVGTLYLERHTAALVRFQFSFTPAAYRDKGLEDISVVLEQSFYEGRWWLPYRQEIEIRRRASVFDFPARGIIRGRWEIGDYDFTATFPDQLRSATEYGGLPAPRPDTTRWTTPLRTAAEGAEPFDRREFDEIKAKAEDLVARRVLEGMPHTRLGTTAVSDLVRVNRVQGLALGLGSAHRINGGYEVRGTFGYGLSDRRVTAALAATLVRGPAEWTADARRAVRDFADQPVVSGAVNSLLAQEAGKDLGDYILAEEIGLALRRKLDSRWTLDLAARWERSSSLVTAASPVRNQYRANPDLGSGSYGLGRVGLSLRSRGAIERGDFTAQLGLEGGSGPTDYLRLSFRSDGAVPAGEGHLRLRTVAGLGSDRLPRARSFVMGGRGTLPGETHRGYGGRAILTAQLEWRLGVPVPAVGLGPFASTGKRAILAPFMGIGWAGGRIEGLPWVPSDGSRAVVGLAGELLQGLIRIEAGKRLRGRGVIQITADIAPEWWPIL
ncbi:MAG TPA: hypothetical protein VGQ17_14110 [Gemmatimonadales bacterium]|jgi:hypothetical protein|nr:hypothetical protein [Gemmatimonadales bacterium]